MSFIRSLRRAPDNGANSMELRPDR